MITLTLAEVTTAVRGRMSDECASASLVSGRVVHDSRAVGHGDLFVAIVGENFDGHDFVEQALEKGAAAAVVHRATDGATINVADTGQALGDLASDVLSRAHLVTVFAVTGSSGKTSTKDMLAQVMAAAGPTVATKASFNNEVGLPMTVLRIEPSTRFLVVEMGARGVGHIKSLCAIARPDVAVVLNVGTAHLGEFGTIDDIATAKGELVEALDPAGWAVLNADDLRVAALRTRTSAQVISFGRAADADVRIGAITTDELARPTISLFMAGENFAVPLQLSGEHQAINAAAVAAGALAAGIAPAFIAEALAAVTPQSRWRMEVTTTRDSTVVINDAYNANPESMAAGLRSLAAMRTSGRRIAVLGEMRELGSASARAHREVGRLACELGVDRIVVVGDRAEPIATGATAAGLDPASAVVVPGISEAEAMLATVLEPGDIVLLKASRAVGLEVLAASVIGGHGGPADGGPAEAGPADPRLTPGGGQ